MSGSLAAVFPLSSVYLFPGCLLADGSGRPSWRLECIAACSLCSARKAGHGRVGHSGGCASFAHNIKTEEEEEEFGTNEIHEALSGELVGAFERARVKGTITRQEYEEYHWSSGDSPHLSDVPPVLKQQGDALQGSPQFLAPVGGHPSGWAWSRHVQTRSA